MISVIIPVRNAENSIELAVNSVRKQQETDIEIICIINGCTDKSEDVIKNIEDDRIVITRSELGIVPALNHGLRIAKGDIIARQDADDVWLPGKLSAQLDFLKNHPEIDILGTQMKVVSPDGTEIRTTQYPIQHKEIVERLLNADNPIGHPSVVFRKKILDKCAGYFDLFPMAEDLDLWTRCIPWYKIANLNQVFVNYTHVHNAKYDPRVPQTLAAWYRMIYGLT